MSWFKRSEKENLKTLEQKCLSQNNEILARLIDLNGKIGAMVEADQSLERWRESVKKEGSGI